MVVLKPPGINLRKYASLQSPIQNEVKVELTGYKFLFQGKQVIGNTISPSLWTIKPPFMFRLNDSQIAI
jgi:hypothetical protein